MQEPGKIPPIEQPPDAANSLYNEETEDLKREKEKHDLKVEKNREKSRGKIQPVLIYGTLGWLILALAAVWFQAYRLWGFYLTDGVLMTLVGSTTINVLGLLAIMLRYLFPNRPDRN